MKTMNPHTLKPSTQDKIDRAVELRHQGLTLQEIGDATGVTRERARQLLASAGLRTMTKAERVDAVAAAWRASGRLRHAQDVAVEHGLTPTPSSLAQLRRSCTDLSLPETKSYGSQWTQDDIVAAVRRIAAERGMDLATDWMRLKDYGAWRADTDASVPTLNANHVWSTIMAEAGFDAKNASKAGRQPGTSYTAFTDDDLDRAVGAFLDTKQPLTTKNLENFLVAHPEMPSLATIRNRSRKRGVGSISGIMADVQARLG